jgi:RimJ/RimL family protein N-acetyltransferase
VRGCRLCLEVVPPRFLPGSAFWRRPSSSAYTTGVHIALGSCIVRDWAAEDLQALVRHANNRNIWLNLRDRFPHPYTEADGRGFLAHVTARENQTVWAIEVDGEAAGGIGLVLMSDVERVSAEIGYWLGEAYWGRGVVTEAVRALTAQAFRQFDLTRIFALPFADNHASIRVLEKAGYALEGRLPQSAIKNGIIRDQLQYGAYKGKWAGGPARG